MRCNKDGHELASSDNNCEDKMHESPLDAKLYGASKINFIDIEI
jgi:hypothetical protein